MIFPLAALPPAEERACMCGAASQEALDLIHSPEVLSAKLSWGRPTKIPDLGVRWTASTAEGALGT